jgi:hypothetical protein
VVVTSFTCFSEIASDEFVKVGRTASTSSFRDAPKAQARNP